MATSSNPPPPDNGKAERVLRANAGRIITEMFEMWDDPYKPPEMMFEAGQEAINQFAGLIQAAALAREIIHKDSDTGEMALGRNPSKGH